MTPAYNMSVADVAARLAGVTRNSAVFHARQVRAMVKEGAIVSPFRGGQHATAPQLFSEVELGRALVLHTLASLDIQMPLLKQAAAASMNVDPTARKGGVTEPTDGIALTLARLRTDPSAKMFLHLNFTAWPADTAEEDDEGTEEDSDLGFSGWVSPSAEVSDGGFLKPHAVIVLPLHRLLAPLVA